jgi:DNA-binding response OmpR family regulator
MSDHKLAPAEDIAATKKDMKKPHAAKAPVINNATGEETQASLEDRNQQMRDFHKVILLIEDEPSASTVCATVLHEMGYDGVQLITQVLAAEQHLDDIVSNLTGPPAAIVLDLGLGYDSGFSVLRKCHAEPRLKKVPILVWTKRSDRETKSFCDQLGADDFLVKSDDDRELRETLKKLLAPKAA